MNTIPKTIGIDLAKSSFSYCLQDDRGRIVKQGELRRQAFIEWLPQLPEGTVVAMEACSGAHHWARRCLEYGLVPRLMAAQFVKPFRKSQLNKNDRNDAEAIATAARQGNMRFVTLKSEDQQIRLAWHRVREGLKAEVLAISNRIRGLLAEFGVVLPQGHAALECWLNDADARAAVPTDLLQALDVLHAQWRETSARMETCQQRIAGHAQQDARSRRIQQMQGIGCVTADAVVATVGNGQDFKNGRQMAAWIGLTPTQHSTGGKARLGHLARRGDGYLRTLLMQGARSCVQRAKAVSRDKATPEQLWIRQLAARMPFTKLLAAIANKHARQLWVMLAREVDYDPCAAVQHPMCRSIPDIHTEVTT